MDGLMWSSMLALGAALGGIAVAALGTTACLLLDALSFAASAALWAALAPTTAALAAPPREEGGAAVQAPPCADGASASASGAAPSSSTLARGVEMARELRAYLREDSAAGVYCALKAAGAASWGALDVMNVRFAAMPQARWHPSHEHARVCSCAAADVRTRARATGCRCSSWAASR
jgi:hypothetical protein